MSTLATAQGPAVAGGHLWHLVTTLAFFVGSLLAVAAGEHLSRRRSSDEPRVKAPAQRFPRLPLGVAAVSAGAAGMVHVMVIPEHFQEAVLYGAFFTVTATCQLLYVAALLWRPSRALLTMGIAGNATLIALWLFSRLVAVPLGPGAGSTEAFGPLDILASSCEVTFLVAAVLALGTAGVTARWGAANPRSAETSAHVFAEPIPRVIRWIRYSQPLALAVPGGRNRPLIALPCEHRDTDEQQQLHRFGFEGNKENQLGHGTVNFQGVTGTANPMPVSFYNNVHFAWLPGSDPNGAPEFYFNKVDC